MSDKILGVSGEAEPARNCMTSQQGASDTFLATSTLNI